MKRVSTAALLCALALGPSHAQEASRERSTAEDAPQRTADQLSPVEVIGVDEDPFGAVVGYRAQRSATATRTDAPLERTPVSIQVLSDDLLRDTDTQDIATATRYVSGVAPSEGVTLISARESLVVRGFLQSDVYFDGFRLSAAPTFDLAGVERLEVLKGPASILYGQVEPGGILNIVTKRPLETFGGQVKGEQGRFDSDRVTVDVHGSPDISGLSGRLVGAREMDESFRDFVFVERDFAMPTAAVKLGDRTELAVTYMRQDERRPFDEGVAFSVDGKPIADISTYLGEPATRGSDFDSDLATVRLEFAASEQVNIRIGMLDQRFLHDFEAFRPFLEPGQEPLPIPVLNQLAALNAIPGLGDLLAEVTDPVGPTEMSRFYDRTSIRFDARQYRADIEWDTAFLGLRHEFLLGVDHRDEDGFVDEFRGLDLIGPDGLFPQKIDIVNPEYGDAVPTQLTADGFSDTRQRFTGTFLQNRLRTPDEHLNILLGLRYDRVDADERTLRAVDQLTAIANPTEPPPEPSDRSVDDDAFTYRAAALYEWTGWLSPFASFSTSFRPASVALQSQADEELDPETGVQYEIGGKFRFFDDRLGATLAVYQIDKENVAIIDRSVAGGRVTNGGEFRSRGVEIDLSGSPLRGLDLLFNYGFTDSEAIRSDVTPEGGSVRGVPRHAGGLVMTYRLLDGMLRGLGGTVSYFASDERQGDNRNSFVLPSYTVTDAALFWGWRYGGTVITPRVGVANLFDEEYYVAGNSLASVVPGAPRTWVASLTVDF